jgi:hypothetical protein
MHSATGRKRFEHQEIESALEAIVGMLRHLSPIASYGYTAFRVRQCQSGLDCFVTEMLREFPDTKLVADWSPDRKQI